MKTKILSVLLALSLSLPLLPTASATSYDPAVSNGGLGSAFVDGGSEMTTISDPREGTMRQKDYLALLKDEAEAAMFTSGARGEPESTGILGGVAKKAGVRSVYGTETGSILLATEWNALTDSVTWTLKDGVLIISGEGPMAHFSESDEDGPGGYPFYNNPYIETVVVEEGVTEVGLTYCKLPNLKTVVVMDASSYVGLDGDMGHHPALETVIFGADLKNSPCMGSSNSVGVLEKTIFLSDNYEYTRSAGTVSQEFAEKVGTGYYTNVLPREDLLQLARTKLAGQPESVLSLLPEELTQGTTGEVSAKCAVTLNANGGTVGQDRLLLTCGEPYGKLPAATRTGMVFLGWFTTPRDGGELVDENTPVPGVNTVMLYARWDSPPSPVSSLDPIYGSDPVSIEAQRQAKIDSVKNDPAYQARLESLRNCLSSDFYGKGEAAWCYSFLTDDVRARSDQICAGLTSDREKVQAIHDWVCENIYYDYPSVGAGHNFSAQETLENSKAVCNGYATLIQAMCWAQGIPAVEVGGKNHAWNVIRVDGQWLWMDATWDSGNAYRGTNQWEKGAVRQNYCLCSSEYMAVEHTAEHVTGNANVSALKEQDLIHYYAIDLQKIYPWRNAVVMDNVLPMNTVDAMNALRAAEGLEPIHRYGTSLHYPGHPQYAEGHDYEKRLKTFLEKGLISDWAVPEVSQAARLGSLAHFSDCRSAATRIDFCLILGDMINEKTGMTIDAYAQSQGKTLGQPFTDTKANAVIAANALGIVFGKGDGRFDPYGKITRQEAATMLLRTAQVLGADTAAAAGVDFVDAGDFSDWAREGIAYCSSTAAPGGKLVMGGVGEGYFDPTGVYTREQAMLTAYRLCLALM